MKKLLLLLLWVPLFVIAQQKSITLQDIYLKNTFAPNYIPGFKSMRDGRFYTQLDSAGNLIKKSFVTDETVAILIENQAVRNEKGLPLGLYDVQWSAKEQKILVFTNRKPIYRHSSLAKVYVYDLATKTTTAIDDELILHPTFSPDATKVAYVKNNNLYIKTLLSNTTQQITFDGQQNSIINGNCDWVYEEEFAFIRAFEWSPNSSFLAYYRFDESKVPTYQFPVYNNLYPQQYTYKYPKAGEANSVVSIHIFNLSNNTTATADIGTETDIYIPRIQWTNNAKTLSIVWLNRHQNNMKLLLAEATTGKTQLALEETDEKYIDIKQTKFYFLQKDNELLYTSEKNGFMALFHYNVVTKKEEQTNKGNYDIISIDAIDENKGIIYFTAAYRSPITLDFCSIKLNGTGFKLIDSRIGNHEIDFNADCTYYLDGFSTITTPPVFGIYSADGKLVRLLETNQKLLKTIATYSFATPQFTKIPNSKGDSLNAWVLLPPSFDKSKQYPVLFCNYGGPGSQRVLNKWNTVDPWHQYLAQKGIIVACIDNTGTGGRGAIFKKKTYLQLGKYEIEDQIDAAKYFATLPYVAPNRIGHWGWSYGGFMSSLAITKGSDAFSLAIAVAPVTNWRFYDNIYTERYMRTPQENPDGYDSNSPINFTNKIKGKFLIIHGTGDDNVHFQNSAMMITEMIKNNIDFESAYYPDKNHSIRGGNTRFHLYSKMSKFVLDNL